MNSVPESVGPTDLSSQFDQAAFFDRIDPFRPSLAGQETQDTCPAAEVDDNIARLNRFLDRIAESMKASVIEEIVTVFVDNKRHNNDPKNRMEAEQCSAQLVRAAVAIDIP